VRIKRWIRVLAVLAVLAVGLGLTAAGALYWLVAPRLPNVQELRHIQLAVPLSVYSRDGKLIAQFGETRRYPVKIAQVPVPVRQGRFQNSRPSLIRASNHNGPISAAITSCSACAR